MDNNLTSAHELPSTPDPATLSLGDGAVVAGPALTEVETSQGTEWVEHGAADLNLREELNATRDALREAREGVRRETELMAEFENDAVHLKDARLIARRMVDVAANLCRSPVLFLSHQENLRSLVLTEDAGFIANDIPVGLSVPVNSDLLTRCETQTGLSVPSVSDYEPLASVLLQRMGIAHFEAWALTGYGQLGRMAGKPRLLGVLVILQAGIDSQMHQHALSRMIRTTGLVYENALLTR